MKEELFDYGNITSTHKKLLFEVIELAKQSGNDLFAEFIKHKFQIIEPNRFDLENSKFIESCKKHKFNYNIQGYVVDGLNPDAVQYPIVSITEDIRKLEEFIKNP
jgi:hypothetical protein